MADEKVSEKLKSGEFSLDRLRKNPWIVTTLFLAGILVISLFMRGSVGSVISEQDAADKLVSFVESQGGSAEVLSTEKSDGFYKVTIDYQGENVPVYVTLDGKYIVPSLVPLSANAVASSSGGNAAPQPKDVPKTDKPVVELFVMSLCPFGLQAEKGILPVVNLLKDKIDFKIKFVNYIMHGQDEINENTRQYCIQKEQTGKFNSYLDCYTKSGDTDSCLASTGIDKAKLTSCVAAADKQFDISANYDDQSSWLSGRFPRYDVNAADNEKYGVAGSPTLVINGKEVSTGRDPASLLAAICSAFNDEPAECQQTLSSAAPNPGFTAGSATGSASAANCIV